jgi:putative SOS response-associated peptidase YedK
MCGRFTQHYTWRELHELYVLVGAARNLKPRYNIAPTTTIDVVTAGDGGPLLVPMRWGLIPWWWTKSAKEMPATFNARAETVAERPMFRDAFERNRCIVPASGYYEWKAAADGKQPYFISAADGGVLSIAGLWHRWKDPASGEGVVSCTLIVTGANALARQVHDRMPVLLARADFAAWLGGTAGVELLRPAAEDTLRLWPVSKRVNSTRTDDEDATLKDEVPPDQEKPRLLL